MKLFQHAFAFALESASWHPIERKLPESKLASSLFSDFMVTSFSDEVAAGLSGQHISLMFSLHPLID